MADETDGISIWNSESGDATRHFRNSKGSANGGESSDASPSQTVTSLDWLNPEGPSLLSVASDDGVVRVWNGLLESDIVFSQRPGGAGGGGGGGGAGGDGAGGGASGGARARRESNEDGELDGSTQGPNLVTAFRAAPDIYPNGPKNAGSGLLTSWNQRSCRLFAGGNSSFLRAWDVAAERCVEL